jgi:hypothetical protein
LGHRGREAGWGERERESAIGGKSGIEGGERVRGREIMEVEILGER